MKKIITLSLLTISVCSFGQEAVTNKEFPLTGKWQLFEIWGSPGEKTFIQKPEDQRIYTFETNGIVKDKLGTLGTFSLDGVYLRMEWPAKEEYYKFYHDENNLHTFYLTPLSEKKKILCNCDYAFEKVTNLLFDQENTRPTIIVNGFVFDPGLPIAGAEIRAKGTYRKTKADKDGKFVIETRIGEVLRAEMNGAYGEITVTNKNCYKIYLIETGLVIRGKKGERLRKKLDRKTKRKVKDGFYDCDD